MTPLHRYTKDNNNTCYQQHNYYYYISGPNKSPATHDVLRTKEGGKASKMQKDVAAVNHFLLNCHA